MDHRRHEAATSRRRCTPPATWCWALAWWLWAVPCLAASPTVVLRSLAPATSPAFEASLGEMLGRLEVTLTRGAADVPLAFVDADLSSGQLVVDSPSRAVTIRRAVSSDVTGDVRVETAAALVAAAIEVLLHTDPPRPPMRAAAPVAPDPPRPPPPASPIGLELGVGIGPRLMGGSDPVDFGASLQALATLPLGLQRPGVLFVAGYQPGFELTGESTAVRGQLLSARLFVQLELARGRLGRLEAGAGGGVDVFSLARFSREGELLRPAPSRLTAAPLVSALVTWRFPLGERVDLFVTASVDGDLRAPRAPPDRPATESADPLPWTVRPMLQLGLTFAPLRTAR
ncbi:MAG: hypothetical protein INH41_01510 [Myxococcaceae bacterium]|jgi:hypothetical protein|nr:hypothetical protein [Myxococcaceae bacterium]MCA3011056.1 hypothetical protein [Myxococcaceae bacterium]